MAVKFNPFTGQLQIDEKGSGGGSSYIDGEVQNFSALPETLGTPAVDSAYLVREAEGTWLLGRKPAGIYIRTANTGTRADDWTYAGEFPDVFNDANLVVYNNTDSTKNVKFDASAIATGTTRTITVPDKNITLDDAADSRTPSSHASSHASAGSDPLAPSDIGAMPQFAATDQTLTAASTTLTAGRARRINFSTTSSSDTEAVLPTTSNQDGDLFQLIRSSNIANGKILVTTSAGGSTLADLGTTGNAGRSFTFRYRVGPNNWEIVPVDAHSADKITSGTLAHERGGLEADVSAYNGLVKISGGSTSAVTVTAAGEALLDDADAAAQRTTLGLGNSATLDTGTTAGTVAEGNHTHTQLHDKSHAMTDATSHTAGNHKVFYSDGSGQIQELALGNSGEVLTSNGATSAPSFAAASGGGVTGAAASASDVLGVSGSDITGVDATADRIVFWDDSASALKYLEAGSGLSISGTTLTATASGGSKTYAVFTATDNQPPASNYATLDTRSSIAVLDFDDATDESAVFVSIIPEGASLGSGLKIRLHWMATTATSGDVVWDVSLERMNTDLDSDSFDTIASGTAAANGTSGILTVTEITLTTIDSVTAGDGYRLKVTRDANNASDTMTGDAELVVCEVRSAA